MRVEEAENIAVYLPCEQYLTRVFFSGALWFNHFGYVRALSLLTTPPGFIRTSDAVNLLTKTRVRTRGSNSTTTGVDGTTYS